ncbi:MAG: putative Ig domain-containing protein, partial [Candidatus Poseidoniaceae archaeon]
MQDIKTGGANYGSGPQWFEVVGTTLYFRADDGGGFELWALDPANIMFGSSVAGATCSISPSLPAGLSIDSSTCTISGTPTAETSNTTYTVTAVMSGVTYQTTVWLSSAYQQLTPSVEGADLFLDVPMTDITFHYNASTATTTAIGNVNGQITTLGNGSTWMVADLYSGTCQSRTGSSPMIRMSYQIGDVHYFDACGGGDVELWAHNTSNGTLWAVTDINTVGDSNVGGYLDVLIGDTLYFSAYDGSGYHLWAHDASNHSTWKAIDSDSNSAVTVYPGHGLIAVDGDVFYFSGQLSNGMELLAYNTSNESVWEAADIKSGSGASNPVSLLSSYYPYSGGSPILSDDVFVFYAGTSSSDRELWAYNISNASAWQVYDINSGSSYSSFPEYIAHVNDVVYFAAECTNNQCNPSRTGRELYAYNATNQSTWLVLDIRVGTDSSHPGMYMPDGRDALIIDDTFYFDASTGANGKELWAHNTSNQTTWLVADINSAGDAKPGFYTQAFIHDGRLYFDADDGIKGRELWVYDPSNDSSWRLTDIAPGSGSSIEKSFGVFGDVFYFGADDGSSGRDLWAYDSSNGSSWLVANPNNQYDSNPERGILIGNTIYFSALEQATGYELYAYQPAEITSSGSSGSCSISPSLPAGLSIDSST